MDIKQLIYLCNLERERHFGRAAEASFVSQPTLSMRLKNLEELGVSLINRGNHFGGFTAEGERVLAWARGSSRFTGAEAGGGVAQARFARHAAPWRGAAVQYLGIGNAQGGQRALPASRLPAGGAERRSAAGGADGAYRRHRHRLFELSTLKELHFQSQPLVETGVELVFHPQHFPKLVGDTPLPLEAVAALPLCWPSRRVISAAISINTSATPG